MHQHRHEQAAGAGLKRVLAAPDVEEAEVFFFKPRPQAYDKNGLISDDRLEAEYDFHDFKPADPYAQAAVNEADPNFANDHPNGTHWKDKDGKWCFASFFRWLDEPRVHVYRRDLSSGTCCLYTLSSTRFPENSLKLRPRTNTVRVLYF